MILDEGDVRARAAEMAAALAARFAPGDRVAAVADNGAAFVSFREAAATLGLYVVPLHPRWTEAEIAVALAKTGATRVALADLRGAGTRATTTEAIGPTILLTSGTTGSPKACLRDEGAERARADELTATYGLTAGDVHLIACPLAHSAPGIFLRACRRVGARTAILSRFDAEAFVRAVRETRATVFFLVPTQVERLLALPHDAEDFASVRAFIVAGAPFRPRAKERLLERLGPGKLWEFYGSSETGTITVAPPSSQPGEAGFVGWPPAGVSVRVDDDGELWVKSAALMSGYLGDEATWRDGHLSVGDLGRVRDDGAIVLVDRKHDTIITGGVNVYPAEVEAALLRHADVEAAVVCGVPDDEWGEVVAAIVALRAEPAQSGGTLPGASDIQHFLRASLAAYKIPKRFRFVSVADIPIGSTGKPLRRVAKDLFLPSG